MYYEGNCIYSLYFLVAIFVIQEIQNVKDVLLKAFVRKINMRNNSTTLVVFFYIQENKNMIINTEIVDAYLNGEDISKYSVSAK